MAYKVVIVGSEALRIRGSYLETIGSTMDIVMLQHPGEPVSYNYGLLSTNNGLLWGCSFGLLVPGCSCQRA